MTERIPTLLFGAFDRHNFGDLLFPHVAAALLGSEQMLYAGLAQRDLRALGGHETAALARLAADWGERPLNIVHAGGELLTCDAWQAAVMLQTPEQAQTAIAQYDRDQAARLAWARRELGLPDLAPYTVAPGSFRNVHALAYNGVGGVDLDTCDEPLRAEALTKLAAADFVGVRDHITHATLTRAGIAARLMPDPAVMARELFGARIATHGEVGELARLRQRFPQGYLALQFSADFGDDATLAQLAAQLDRAARDTGLGIALFRAGAAPWHDQLEPYQRLAARMHAETAIFESLDIWDICALIAHSRAYCGGSLHGRIVAMAYGLPRISLLHPDQEGKPGKQAAYAETWEVDGVARVVGIRGIAEKIVHALTQDRTALAATAARLSRLYREGFEELRGKLG